METNNEFMILSLLNLYTSYVNVKKNAENPGRKPFCNRVVAAELINKERFSGVNIAATSKISTFEKKVDYEFEQSNTATTTKPTLFDNEMTYEFNHNKTASTTESTSFAEQLVYEFDQNITKPITTVADAKQEKCRVKRKRRRRGEAKEVEKKKPRVRRWRVRPINIDRMRTGYHRKVFPNVKKMDNQQFFEHTRMSKSLYDWLLSFTHSSLRKSRQSILAEERLALTLNYLAYGTSLQSIAFKHKIGKSTARQIVLDTCGVLVTLLTPLYLAEPTTSQYIDIAEDFENKWYIPNCIGAIDAKRLILSNPRNKEDNNLIVFAACDTKYKFSAINIGQLNKQCESGLFKFLTSDRKINPNDIPLPTNRPLHPASSPFPYYFISGTAFPLRNNIMRPYTENNLDTTKSIFNFKISRARSIIENAFGILTARFRVLLSTIEFLPDGCKLVALACIALHNYIMTNDENQLYCPPTFVDKENEYGIIEEGEWRNELKRNGDQALPSDADNDSKSTKEAKHLRNILADYFASEAISYEIEIA